MRSGLLLVFALGLLTACTPVTVFDQPATSLPITRIALEYTPAARKQTDEDVRFNPELLRDAIAAELESKRLLDLQHPDSGRALVIKLEEFEVRPTSNVVVFGRLPSAGVLDGTARISAKGSEAQEFRVRADVSMKVPRDIDDKNPLKSLYRGFAEEFVAALAGDAQQR